MPSEQVAGYIPQRPMPCSLAPEAQLNKPEQQEQKTPTSTAQCPADPHQRTAPGDEQEAAPHLRGGGCCTDCCVYACGIVAFIKILDCICDR